MIRIKDLAKRAAELGMPAVAMTDHGNLYGAIKFYQECNKAGVKPIFGCEIYLAPGSMEDKKELVGRKRSTHMTLLAENNEGWNNLSKLVSKGNLEGLYHGKPRVDRDALREYSKGVICLTGCISGPVNEWLRAGDEEKARETLEEIVGHLRQGKHLRRDPQPRPRTAAACHPFPAEICEGNGPQGRRGQRRAFPPQARPRGARRDDLHRHRAFAHRREPHALHAGSLFQDRRADARDFRRRPRCLRHHVGNRGTLQRHAQARFHQFGKIPAIRHARRQPARGIPHEGLPRGTHEALRRGTRRTSRKSRNA